MEGRLPRVKLRKRPENVTASVNVKLCSRPRQSTMVFKSSGKAAPAIGQRSLSSDDRYALIIPIPAAPLKETSKGICSRDKKAEGGKEGEEKPNLFRIPHLSLLRCPLAQCSLARSGLISFWRRGDGPTGTSNAIALPPSL